MQYKGLVPPSSLSVDDNDEDEDGGNGQRQ